VTSKKGSCLCGTITFEVDGAVRGVGQCHCSLCQKSSGANGNAVFLVPIGKFKWLSGKDHQTTFHHKPTWSITRCKTCGSPLPYSYDGKQVWVTAGLMDDALEVGIGMHIFCASKADWDVEDKGVRHFDEFPV
jgi:hypothetical protein